MPNAGAIAGSLRRLRLLLCRISLRVVRVGKRNDLGKLACRLRGGEFLRFRIGHSRGLARIAGRRARARCGVCPKLVDVISDRSAKLGVDRPGAFQSSFVQKRRANPQECSRGLCVDIGCQEAAARQIGLKLGSHSAVRLIVRWPAQRRERPSIYTARRRASVIFLIGRRPGCEIPLLVAQG